MKNKKDDLVLCQRDVLTALRTLRLFIREVGGNYLASLQAEVARTMQAIESADLNEKPPRKAAQRLRAMHQLINSLDVEPNKGRRRDLKRLDKVICKLGQMVDGW